MNHDTHPRISAVLLGVTWLEVAILLWAGLGLLLYPPIMEPFWPWPLTPFNLRYLGALYTAALVAAFLQAWSGRWLPARVVTPMIFLFTLVVTICSFIHIERFDLHRPEAHGSGSSSTSACASMPASISGSIATCRCRNRAVTPAAGRESCCG